MVPWWKRLVFSIVASLVGIVACEAISWLATENGRFESGDWGMVAYIALCSIPGWVVGLPFALLVKNVQSPRFLGLLLIGTTIGPLMFVVEAYCIYVRDQRGTGVYLDLFWMEFQEITDLPTKIALATGVAVLTTLIFLVLLRRALDKAESGSELTISDKDSTYLKL